MTVKTLVSMVYAAITLEKNTQLPRGSLRRLTPTKPPPRRLLPKRQLQPNLLLIQHNPVKKSQIAYNNRLLP